MNYKQLSSQAPDSTRESSTLRSLCRVCLMVALVALFTGCNTRSLHMDERYNPPVYWGQHVVKRGETLYSIAWRYGRDYRELGNANGISPPYHIQAGQVLRLDLRGEAPRQTAAASGAGQPAARPSTGQSQAPTRPAAGSSQSRPAGTPTPAATPAPRPAPAPTPQVTRRPDTSVALSRQNQTVGGIQWQWPHVGTILAKFSTSGSVNKGIDIAGDSGDPVRAAAAGNVVYAGSGLLGYGNLIIINHNEHYLSAYAHNRRILVSEGEEVKAGQVIAELGNTGTDRNKLHFEIRRNGNPVDPMPYLPPR